MRLLKNKVLFRTMQIALAAFLVILIQKCGGDDSVNPSGTYMGGTITYTGTNLRLTDGYYSVSFYADSTNPLSYAPVKTDSLSVSSGGNLVSVYYKESNLPTGNYYIASTWVRNSDHRLFIIGGFGCNISPHCPAPTKVAFPNYAGTGALDFLSRSDPDSAIYP